MYKPDSNFQDKVCDFWSDCNDGADEAYCPKEYLFENCKEELCYWNEEPPDELDWLIAQDNDSYTHTNGPYEGGSHFLYLYGKLGSDGDYSNQVGRIFSPEYTQSATDCKLDLFYYLNGDLGTLMDSEDPAALVVGIRDTENAESVMPVDYLYSHNVQEWLNRKIQIGRRSGRFEVCIGKLILFSLHLPKVRFFIELHNTCAVLLQLFSSFFLSCKVAKL